MIQLFIIALFLFIGAGVTPFLHSGPRFWRYCCITQGIAGVVTIIAALSAVMVTKTQVIATGSLTSFFPLELGVDRLSAGFILLLGILSVAVSMYTPGYLSRLHGGRERDMLCGCIPFFLAGMMLVLLAHTTMTILIFWELMAMVSFFLVLTEFHEEQTRRAAFFYFAMTQLSTVCIVLSCILMYLITGSGAFPEKIGIEDGYGAAAFILLFLGVAIKAGVIPMHKWLVYAHPAAPSPVSALMSGMMLNTALYLLIRAVTDLFTPTAPAGYLLLIFGCLTAVLGVMYALKESDLKGLLAYSSIDNTGIILIGIGLYTLLMAEGYPSIAMTALLGSLFHAFNHGVFKGLLFLTAGSVHQAAGTKYIDHLGGLLVRMPVTGALFFIGVLSITALPPLNGFVGELLIYQALITGLMQTDPLMQIILISILSLVGLTGALTAVCFIKAFGLTFLALPRTHAAKQAREVPLLMQAGPAFLAAICILTGMFSSQILTVAGYPGYIPDFFLLSLLLLTSLGVTYAAVFMFASRQTRTAPTWGCGMPFATSRMEYTGSGFTEPVLRIFSPLYRTKLMIHREYVDSGNCFLKSGSADLHLVRFFEEYLYLPLSRLVEMIGEAIGKLQNGEVDRYVLLVLVTVTILIGLIGWFP